jgi:hypothetical protein
MNFFNGVCTWQAFPAMSNIHSGLKQKFVNYGRESFIALTPVLMFGSKAGAHPDETPKLG